MWRKLLEVAPSFLPARIDLGAVLLAAGKPAAALAVVQEERNEDLRLVLLPIVLQANGRQVQADEALQALIARCGDEAPVGIAMNYAYRGDHDLALQWLERAYVHKDTDLSEIVGDRLLENMIDDPRY